MTFLKLVKWDPVGFNLSHDSKKGGMLYSICKMVGIQEHTRILWVKQIELNFCCNNDVII